MRAGLPIVGVEQGDPSARHRGQAPVVASTLVVLRSDDVPSALRTPSIGPMRSVKAQTVLGVLLALLVVLAGAGFVVFALFQL